MKTSSFSKQSRAKFDGAVSISVGQPKYVKVSLKYGALAPRWDLLNAFRNDEITEAQYIVSYNAMLSKLNAKKVFDELHHYCDGSEPVLLCHCGIKDFCHRHLAAEWLEKELGIQIDEVNDTIATRKNGRLSRPEQQILF